MIEFLFTIVQAKENLIMLYVPLKKKQLKEYADPMRRRSSFLAVSLIIFGQLLVGVTTNMASATECFTEDNVKLPPMAFTLTEWTSNGITKEFIDSSYTTYRDGYFPRGELFDKLNSIPLKDKTVNYWFEKSTNREFSNPKKIGWTEFPSQYRPYIEYDTVVWADTTDWLRFAASIQIKDCGPAVTYYSSAAKYPEGKLPITSIPAIMNLKEGISGSNDSNNIEFKKDGISPWHFKTQETVEQKFEELSIQLKETRELGEEFLIPNRLGFEQLRTTVRPITPTDCLGFEFNNLEYTNEGWKVSFSNLPCTIMILAQLPPKLYDGPSLYFWNYPSRKLACFDCYTEVIIAKVTVKEDSSKKEELVSKQEAEAKIAAELKAKQEAEAKVAADKAAEELKAKQDAEAKGAGEKIIADAKAEAARILAAAKAAAAKKKTTITCVKGKLTKKVTAVKPVCPKGYKKK